MQKRVKSFDGTNINYDICHEKNKNNYLFFIHGTGGNLKAWKRIRLFFHKLKIPTIAVDLRGHGKSDRPKLLKDYNLKYFAKDIKAVIKKEHLHKPTLVGHSLGGMVVLTFHELYPNSSKKYVIISSASKAPKRLKSIFKKLSFLIKFLNKILRKIIPKRKKNYHINKKFFKHLRDDNLMRIAYTVLNTSLKSWLFTFENINKFNEEGILGTIKKPVLILSGGKDNIVEVNNSKHLHSLIKSSKLKIFPKADHIIILTHPRKVGEEIYNFIRKK